MFYKLVGKRVVACKDVSEWSKWFGKHNRIVAIDNVGDWTVSTVFIGIDEISGIKPYLFETQIFATGKQYNGDTWTARTWAEAVRCHQKALNLVLCAAYAERVINEI